MVTRTDGFKRWMSLFLCIVMFASMLPIGSAFAEETAEVLFSVSPAEAWVAVYQNGEEVNAEEAGRYILSPGTYTWSAGCDGYYAKTGIEFTIPSGAAEPVRIDVNLEAEPAPVVEEPVVEEPAPVVEEPVVEESAPVVEEPVVGESAPTVVENVPVAEQASTPATQEVVTEPTEPAPTVEEVPVAVEPAAPAEAATEAEAVPAASEPAAEPATAQQAEEEPMTEITVSGDSVSSDAMGLSVESATVELKKAQKSGSGLKVTWVALTGAEYYRVYRKAPGETDWTKIGETKKTEYTDTKVSNGKKYTYTVRAVRNSKYSKYDKNGVSATYYTYNTPKLESVTVTADGLKVTWSGEGGTFRVYRKGPGDTSWVTVSDVKGTSYVDKQVVSGNKYTYTVRVLGSKSDYDHTGKSATYYAKAVIDSLTNTWDTSWKVGVVNIKWNAVPGVTWYRVERKLKENEWNSASTKVLAITDKLSYNDRDVSSDHDYSYRIMSVNNDKGSEILGTFDATGKNIRFYDTPYLDKDPVINTKGVTINWKAVAGVRVYRVYRKVPGGEWQKLADVRDATTYTDKTAAGGQSYVYTVRCWNNDVTAAISGYDKDGIVVDYTNVPALKKAEPFQNNDIPQKGIRLTWKKVSGVTEYQVYRKVYGTDEWQKPNGTGGVVPAGGGDTEVFIDEEAANFSGTKFVYTVRCITPFESHYNEKGVTATFYPTPTNLTADPTPYGIDVTWDQVPGAPLYQIYRRLSPSGSWDLIGSTPENTFTDDGSKLTSGVTYDYEVCVLNLDGEICSARTTAAKLPPASIPFFAAPELISLNVTTAGLKLTWKGVGDCTTYHIYRKTKNSEWVQGNPLVDKNGAVVVATTKSGDNFVYTDDTVKSGTTYTYTVICWDGTDETSMWDPVGLTATFYGDDVDIKDFAVESLTNKTDGILVKWNAVNGISKYYIYRREKDTQAEAYKKIGESTTTSFLDKSIKNNNQAEFHYSVRCVDENGKVISSYAKELPKAFQRWITPKLNSISMKSKLSAGDPGKIILEWTAVDGAPSYNVYRRTNNGDFGLIGNVSSPVFTDPDDALKNNLKSGATYAYYVRVANGSGKNVSDYDTPLSIVFLSTPQLQTPEVNKKGILVKWEAVEGAEGYRIYRQYKSGSTAWSDWELVKKVSGYATLTWTDTDVLDSSDYKYTVRAYKGNTLSGYVSDGVTKSNSKYLSAPTIKSLSSAASGVKITWSPVEGASGYEYRVKKYGGSWGSWKSVSGTSTTCTSANKSGVRYVFQVRAVDGSKKGEASATKEIIFYGQPSNIQVKRTALGSEYATVKISWTGINGASKYRVLRKTENGSWKTVGDTKNKTLNDKKAVVNREYTYTVRALDSNGNYIGSYDSNGATIVIPYKLSAPTLKTAKAAKGSITVTWGAVSGAAQYQVYRKTEDGKWTKVGKTTGTSFKDTNTKKGVYYYYTVRCLSKSGSFVTSSYNSTGIKALAK